MKRAALFVLLAATALTAPAWAKDAPKAAPKSQGGGVDLTGGKSGTPLEVYSDSGMELSQDLKTVIAHGNAKAIRGNITVRSDTMIAYYRDKTAAPGAQPQKKPAKTADKKADKKAGAQPGGDDESGGSEIWRVEAIDHVTIASPSQTVYGDHADYNIDNAVVVVTGKDLKMVTPTDLITARDTLEYWDQKQIAVARGNAKATRADKSVAGDVLTADFAKDSEGKMAITKAHADKNVVLTTPTEVVTGDHADYDVESGIVIITGNDVHLTREQNTLDGQYAVINLNTGISKLYPVPPGVSANGQQRVKGFFVPQKKGGDDQAPAKGKGQ